MSYDRRPRNRRLPFELLDGRYCLDTTVISHAVVSSEIVDPSSLAAADFDDDGDLDLLVGGKGQVSWFENTGNSAEPYLHHLITVRSHLVSGVAAIDMDGDGDLDALSVMSSDGVSWHENLDGRGTFGRAMQVVLIRGAYAVAVTDLDGDLDDDLILASRPDSASNRFIDWYENQGGRGSFQLGGRISTTQGASLLSLRDIDQDGDLDLINGSTRWYEFERVESLVNWTERTHDSGNRSMAISDAADLDGDGDLDLIGSPDLFSPGPYAQGLITWRENLNGAREFSERRTFDQIGIGQGLGFGPIKAGDFDGDGDVDLIAPVFAPLYSLAGEYPAGYLLGYENTGPLGGFAPAVRLSNDDLRARDIALADLDQDGIVDPIAVSIIDDSVNVFPSRSAGPFGIRHAVALGATGYEEILTVDVDGDRDQDLVAGPSWFENLDGQGNFQEMRQLTPDWALAQPFDLDGDGDLDRVGRFNLFFDTVERTELRWYENRDGVVDFGPAQVLQKSDGSIYDPPILVIDVDVDGDADIVTTDGLVVEWFENLDGRGAFAASQLLEPETGHRFDDVLAGDLDHDGDQDLIFTHFGAVYWRENQAGSFGPATFVVRNVSRRFHFDTFLRDMDGDGSLDLLLHSLEPTIWFNDGTGNFAESRVVPHSTRAVLPADVDGDGDLDIVAYGDVGDDADVAWLRNENGTGRRWTLHQIAMTNSSRIVVDDFDGDGDLDVVASSSPNDGAVYLENRLEAGFASAVSLSNPTFNVRFAVGDFDGDGDADLGMASFSDLVLRIQWFADRVPGDANADGIFDSSDLVYMFQAGKYEDMIDNNASLQEGDWNRDGDFDSSDLVYVFQFGLFQLDDDR